MKTIVSGLWIIFSFGQLWAQYSIKVEEDKQKIADGNHPCLVVPIYQSTPDDVSDAWAKLMKSYDAKVSSHKEIFADNALIKDISGNTVDVYARCDKKSDDELEFIVAVDLGGAFLNSSDHSAQIKVMKKILKEFAKQATLDGLDDKIKDQDKVCQKRQKELDGLVKDKAKLEKDIEYYKKKIADAENDMKQNLDDQTSKQKEIDTEKQKFEELGKQRDKVD
jgi:hypothetical protein